MDTVSLDAINTALRLGDKPILPYGTEIIFGAIHGMCCAYHRSCDSYEIRWESVVHRRLWQQWVYDAGCRDDGSFWVEGKTRQYKIISLSPWVTHAFLHNHFPPRIIHVSFDALPFHRWDRDHC